MNLSTTPFSNEENYKKYILHSFTEMGIPINILNRISNKKSQSVSSKYCFGVIIDDRKYWYFLGQPVAENRTKMREIFKAILSFNSNNGAIPFIYKKRT